MANRPRKIPELSAVTNVADTDLFIVEQVSGNTSTTFKITGLNLKKSFIKGPYADDATANTAGVSIGTLYYTSGGDVKVRLA